ncbi:MAG: hypothetical protein C6I05_04660 [Epsilonproteobacteria bacterium]|nr:hypothetical protein [Campylobacterota bacterium]
MSDFLIGYRDPLFGLIVLFALVFIISFFSYWWAIYKSREQDLHLRRFFRRFEQGNRKIVEILERPNSHKALLLLADALAKSGEYEEAIAIYLRLQEYEDREGRLEILVRLADLYRKAGFLGRSREIYEEILGIIPRHREALRSLLIVYERLRDFEGAFDVLESLEEIENIEKERGYLEALQAAEERDTGKLVEIYRRGVVKRSVLEPLFSLDPQLGWNVIREEDIPAIIDILWYLPPSQISTAYPLLKELYSAKGYIREVESSSLFELDLLLHYPRADLEFIYLCQGCKRRFPLAFGRCPTCGHVEEMVVELIVTQKKGKDEKGTTF